MNLIPFTQEIFFEGLKVRYLDVGQGPTMLLLHGYCEDLTIFELIVKDLAQKNRVVAVDLPGHGGTDLIPGCHNLDNVAEWLSIILRKLKVENFFFVGHSMGGYIASAYAAQWPERLRGLCLLHSKAGPDTSFRQEQRDKTIHFIELHGVKAFVRGFAQQLFYTDTPDFVRRLQQIGGQLSDDAILAFTEGMRDRRDYRRFIADLSIPILYIAGKHDSLLNAKDIRNEYIMMENVKGLIMQNAGHMAMYEAPGDLIETLLNFAKHYVH